MDGVTVITHPLVQHRLSLLRDRHTDIAAFRRLMRDLAVLLGYEALRDLPVCDRAIETPVAPTEAPFLVGEPPVIGVILRAANGLLDGMLDLLPDAPVAYIGLYRDKKTFQPVQYYFKAPKDLGGRPVILIDPMLATGHSAAAAATLLKEKGATDLRFICVLAAPEGVKTLRDAHPDMPVLTAAIDSHLDAHAHIVPGLGDAGDRLYGTE